MKIGTAREEVLDSLDAGPLWRSNGLAVQASREGVVFLAVETEHLLQGRGVRALRARGQLVRVPTLADAEARLAERRWTGAIIGLRAGGEGLAWLASLRKRGETLPVLLLADGLEKEVASVCHRLDARCVFAPVDARTLVLFAVRAAAQRACREERVAAVVAKLAVERGLSRREAEVAQLAAMGVSRSGLAASLGVSDNSVKAHIRGLLRRTGEPSVEAVGRAVLEDVVRSWRGSDPAGAADGS